MASTRPRTAASVEDYRYDEAKRKNNPPAGLAAQGRILEQAKDVVAWYARNDGLDFVIPYAYHGVDHNYEPDFLVRMTDGTTMILEIKGHLTDQDRQKHEVAKRWVKAVNNWGGCGTWAFHVCRDPQLLASALRQRFPPSAQAAD